MLTLQYTEQRTWLRASARLMGTDAEVLVDGSAGHVAAAFLRLRGLERAWSRFDPASELNRLYDTAGRWTRVSDDLLRALCLARRLHDETVGLFDPTVRRALQMLGYDRTFCEVLDDNTPFAPVPAPGLDALEVDLARRRVRIDPGLLLDLGGIGKGLAADIVATDLVAAGARASYVSLGGDIHVCGEPPNGVAWPVPLLHPISGVELAVHPLGAGGLAMSTVALRRWHRGGHEVHHIVDPRTGTSCATDLVAVAVAAPSTARAEALAKVAIILGEHDGRAMLERCGVVGWLVTANRCVTVGVDGGG